MKKKVKVGETVCVNGMTHIVLIYSFTSSGYHLTVCNLSHTAESLVVWLFVQKDL